MDLGNFAHEHIPQFRLLLHELGECGIVQLNVVGLLKKKHVGSGRKAVKELDFADEGLPSRLVTCCRNFVTLEKLQEALHH